MNGQQTNYTLDLNAGLTQVLADGTNTYTYGLGRISQTNTVTEYFLSDALGSVRQLTNASGAITYAKAYDPYGVVISTSGASQSAYGYTGEQQSNNMVYLRSRYYAPGMGRFLTRDTWGGDYQTPLTLNAWNYTSSNPINYSDPSGHCYNPDGSWNWLGWPPFGLGPCSPNINGSTIVLTPTLISILTATATCTPTPTSTSTPTSTATLTPISTPTTYNSEVITGWGCQATDDACRSDRAKKVWGWISNSNSWWGDHRSPDPKDLATWLLEHEGQELRNDHTKTYVPNGYKWLQGIHAMVGRFSQLFGDGNITPLDLSTFTAFFNPNRGDTFDSNDWRQLTKRPQSYWRTDVDNYWAGGVYHDEQGHAVTRWWDDSADVASGYCSTGCNVSFSVYIL